MTQTDWGKTIGVKLGQAHRTQSGTSRPRKWHLNVEATGTERFHRVVWFIVV